MIDRRTLISAPLAVWLAAPPKLAIVRPTLHYQREEGPPISSTYQYIPGELLFFSFRISGYQVTKDAVDLRYQLVLTDPEGLLVMPPITGAVKADVNENDKEWLPRGQETIPLPPQIPSGTYTLKLRVADEYSKSAADQEIPFRVRGRAAERADSLEIRDVQFFRDEEGKKPAIDSRYRGGDTLWARFEIVGFRLGEKNRFEVEYGLSVFRPSGKVLYTEPKAAAEQDAPFYPKRNLQGVLSLNLSADLPPGEYGLTILVRDKTAEASTESKVSFQVE